MENTTDLPRITSVSQHVAANVRRMRAKHGWSLAQLSEQLSDSGYPMSLKMLSKLETGERGISVDDAHALALVLDATPETLMMPSSLSEQRELASALEHWRRACSEGMEARGAVAAKTRRAERDASNQVLHLMGDDPAHHETVRAHLWELVKRDGGADVSDWPDLFCELIAGMIGRSGNAD